MLLSMNRECLFHLWQQHTLKAQSIMGTRSSELSPPLERRVSMKRERLKFLRRSRNSTRLQLRRTLISTLGQSHQQGQPRKLNLRGSSGSQARSTRVFNFQTMRLFLCLILKGTSTNHSPPASLCRLMTFWRKSFSDNYESGSNKTPKSLETFDKVGESHS